MKIGVVTWLEGIASAWEAGVAQDGGAGARFERSPAVATFGAKAVRRIKGVLGAELMAEFVRDEVHVESVSSWFGQTDATGTFASGITNAAEISETVGASNEKNSDIVVGGAYDVIERVLRLMEQLFGRLVRTVRIGSGIGEDHAFELIHKAKRDAEFAVKDSARATDGSDDFEDGRLFRAVKLTEFSSSRRCKPEGAQNIGEALRLRAEVAA